MAKGYPDYQGNKSKVYSFQDWVIYEGGQITLSGTGALAGFGTNAEVISYTVAAGYTLYMFGFSAAMSASAAADGDKDQMLLGALTWAGAVYTLYGGGNGGFTVPLGGGYKALAGETVSLRLYCRANHNCTSSGAIWGVLVAN